MQIEQYLWEFSLLLIIVAFMAGCLVTEALRNLALWAVERFGEEIHPRELPAVVRAEVQDLDQWTGKQLTDGLCHAYHDEPMVGWPGCILPKGHEGDHYGGTH